MRDEGGVVWHAAYPLDADGAGFRHPGPVIDCTAPECRLVLEVPTPLPSC